VFSPLLVGFVLGPVALGGLLIGVIISGLLLALMMTTGGAAWDNAKNISRLEISEAKRFAQTGARTPHMQRL